jgi:outer membrane protein TolC
MTLDEALSELESSNPTLLQSRSRALEAKGLSRQALAPLLPSLTLQGSYTRNSDEARVPVGALLSSLQPPAGRQLPDDFVIQPLQVWNATAALRVPLLAPRAWADWSASRHAASSAEEAASGLRLSMRAALIQAAWACGAAEETVEASVRADASARAQAESAARAVEVGVGTPLAVLQAQTEAVKRQADLVSARAELQRGRLALGILLGREAPVSISLPPVQSQGAPDIAALREKALAARPELSSQREAAAAARSQLRSARLRLLPELAATAVAFKQDVPFPTGKDSGYRASIELTWSLYDGGFRYGKQRQAEALVSAATAAELAARLEVVQQVEDAAREVRVAEERLGLAQKQRALAAEAARVAQRGFGAGTASSLDVLDANDRFYQSEVGLAQARARLGVAWAGLDRATGGR